ncbi:chromosome segregation protein SMC [Candidatus Pacearchaeota archaeon]|nr:chromosome segregation protein SMC [Candidatus Pacearchaeota archaeon]
MVFIKRMVMNGFKSFARKTEVVFDKGINVILGPNGSGKSNISDALCFVLGRLSIKSMRAAKAKNLIFMGSKYIKPAHEAMVELVFDNSDKGFAIDSDEVSLKRIVRSNGQGIYKINDETKTRSEVIEMLAQAGIDPYGFNIILQGQIQSIVKMHPEERRKIIEEVAGIAIYESRKEKSLKELEKTDEKLKEISTILRERTALLRNLEKEKAQAQRFKELELTVKRAKASLLHKRGEEKNKELQALMKSMEEKSEAKDEIKEKVQSLGKEIEDISDNIQKINKHIQQATGLEQETLHTAIANLKAELEGLKVRRENYEHRKSETGRENYEHRKSETEKRIAQMSHSIPELENEMKQLRGKSPLMAKKAEELKKKKLELQELEEEKKKALTFKSELNNIRERIKDKERQVTRINAESEHVLKQLEEYSSQFTYPSESECKQAIQAIRKAMGEKKLSLHGFNNDELMHEKALSIAESEIGRLDKLKNEVGNIDVCPLCQSKITENHIEHVFKEADSKIQESKNIVKKSQEELKKLRSMREIMHQEIKEHEQTISSADIELVRHTTSKTIKEQLKNIVNEEKALKEELKLLEDKRKSLESKTFDNSIEDRYESKILEIEEISSRTEEDVDTTLLYKEREVENIRNIVKRSTKDLEELENSIGEISESLESKNEMLKNKEEQEKELNEKFKRMFEERDNLQKIIQEKNFDLAETQQMVREVEDQVNYLRIGKAKLDAEKEAVDIEMTEYAGIELLQGSVAVVDERLKKSQEALQQIGSINMRALEVYEDVKKEYDVVQEKVTTLEKEKIDIMKIVEEIDHKKSRTFLKTFRAMNEIFTENFGKLYTKGVAFLELENKEEIFAGGVNIVVKLAKGKYFDVTSLSGGEQTLVALSLLFAIQEYKPYHFYIFDEIDAALDKRNSERLAGLLQQYMKAGQYVVITHNDAIILNANVLYGVSMHDSVSKILSLKVLETQQTPLTTEPPTQELSAPIEEDLINPGFENLKNDIDTQLDHP